MEISKRLEMAANLVTPGNVTADIGTDHAYLPVWLIERGRIPRAIAMDVVKGPLAHAAESITKYRMTDRIETRLSDGLCGLQPGEADTAVLAGMGGALVIRILENSFGTVRTLRELVLQPQSEIAKVRRFLDEHGLSVVDEDMVLEEGKYYTAMKVKVTPGETGDSVPYDEDPLSREAEYRYGPVLLKKRPAVLDQYLRWEYNRMSGIAQKLKNAKGEQGVLRRKDLQHEMDVLQNAVSRAGLPGWEEKDE